MALEILSKTREGAGLHRPEYELLETAVRDDLGRREEAAFIALHGCVMADNYILKEDTT